MKKGIAGILCFLIFAFNIPSGSALSDVRSGSQLETDIILLQEKNIISGYPDATFKPEKEINRAEALKMIFELVKEESGSSSVSGFSDVPETAWFSKYVAKAKKKTIVEGYSDGTFRPEQPVNRAEFLKIAMLTLPFFDQIPFSKEPIPYTDIEQKSWYSIFLQAGIFLEALPKTKTFRAGDPMKRGDAAAIIAAIARYIDSHPGTLSKDIPYVPEEAFTIIDPTLEDRYAPEEFGPDKLIVKRDFNKTDIQNTFAGYRVVIDELVDVTALENNASELTISYDSGCVVDIYFWDREDFTPQSYFEYKAQGFMVQPQKRKLVALKKYEKLEAYKIINTWGRRDIEEQYMVFTKNTIYEFSAFGSGEKKDKECKVLVPKVLEKFSVQ